MSTYTCPQCETTIKEDHVIQHDEIHIGKCTNCSFAWDIDFEYPTCEIRSITESD